MNQQLLTCDSCGNKQYVLKSIGCFVKKPITTEQPIRRIKAELE